MTHMKRSAVVIAVTAAVWAGVASSPVLASCAALPSLRESLKTADVVFVGTVQSTSNADRWAAVEVDEVWKGSDVPKEVEVRGGPEDPAGPLGVASSVDTTYEPGVRYLFVPVNSGPPYRDNSCTPTRRYAPVLDRFRPRGGVHQPVGDGPSARAEDVPLTQSDYSWVVIGVAVAVLSLVVGIPFGARRTAFGRG
jgi:hypothetical protein